MATPESLVAALARGLVEGLLGASAEKTPRKDKAIVAKTADIEAAVAKYIDAKLGEGDGPVQEPLFPEPGIEVGEPILRAVHEARARAEAANNGQTEDPPPGMFYPDQPGGQPWTTPVR